MTARFRIALSLALTGPLACCTLPSVLAADPAPADRFTPLAGFEVQEVVTPDSTGSLVAMTFNEAGAIIASREQGPLLLIQDKDKDGKFESVSTFCDQVKNCQGILALGEHVFAVGTGPSGGAAFHKLTDADGDGVAEKVDVLFKFKGGMGEHGPHAPVLGPDGLIYIMIGNHAFVEPTVAATSPHHHYYDAELFTPKYEDANGHAAGIKAPGGTVVRTDTKGSFIELFLGGFRNAYDHAFNRDGELFTFDSDMEWDTELPWYRPTRVNHLIPGAEFGWRSGWSKWPNYFVDSLPSTLDIGRGSPTGVEFYNHERFPKKYDGAFFICDWSQGRVLAVTMEPKAGSYQAQSEIFLEGRPLNCSDIAVGPDGWLYIAVGGRNTAGSILRVVAKDAKPLAAPAGNALERALHQPQLNSAWGRRAVREAKKEAGEQWGPGLVAVAVNAKAPEADRTRALDLMQLLGPEPSAELLVQLSKVESAAVRGRAVYLLGVHPVPAGNARLVELLADPDATVRRRACEALVRARHPAPADKLYKLMAERHPFVSWAARRALEELPRDQWQAAVLAANDPRVFIVGSVALVTLGADKATAGAILDRSQKLLSGEISDDDLVGLLRVVELALHVGNFQPNDLPALREQVSKRFPSGDYRINREAIRVLVMMQEPTLAPRLVQHLRGKAPLEERIQAAALARFLSVGWTPELRSELLDFLALARTYEGGNSYRGYLANFANDILKTMPAEEQLARIADGVKHPDAALGIVRSISGTLTPPQQAALIALDRELTANKSDSARELQQAVAIALGFGDDAAASYLAEVFESTPDRRQDAALALATYAIKHAERRASDWPLLIRSLTVVDGATAREVLKALAKFPQKSDKPQDFRQVILLGLKLGDSGGREAAMLLARWADKKAADQRGPVNETLANWQKWYVEKFPDQPEPVLPVEAAGNRWTYAQLLDFVNTESGKSGNAERGAVVFEKSQCVKCHRYGTRGEGIGPDLSNVSSRFQRKEILESVFFPSQVISDQFAAKTVITTDGKTFTGLVGPTGDGGVVVLQANTEKVTVPKNEIEQITPSKKSAMPEGLFNTLSLEEIADLFAYLARPAGK